MDILNKGTNQMAQTPLTGTASMIDLGGCSTGFAIVRGGLLDTCTVSDTKDGAIINAILFGRNILVRRCANFGCDCMDRALAHHLPDALLVEVVIQVVQPA